MNITLKEHINENTLFNTPIGLDISAKGHTFLKANTCVLRIYSENC